MRMNRIHQSIVTHIPGRGMRGQTVLFLFLLLLSACSGRGKGDAGERIITVTMEPQRYFTEAIAGDKFTVRSMVPKGSSPRLTTPPRSNWYRWVKVRHICASAISDSNARGWTG